MAPRTASRESTLHCKLLTPINEALITAGACTIFQCALGHEHLIEGGWSFTSSLPWEGCHTILFGYPFTVVRAATLCATGWHGGVSYVPDICRSQPPAIGRPVLTAGVLAIRKEKVGLVTILTCTIRLTGNRCVSLSRVRLEVPSIAVTPASTSLNLVSMGTLLQYPSNCLLCMLLFNLKRCML
jgi:hypothetical protein